jgi:hypothetical protein
MSRGLNVALTTHHMLKTGLAQGSRKVVIFGVDSEGPKDLEACGSAIHFEQNNFLRAEEVGYDLAQTLDSVLVTPAFGQPFSCRFHAYVVRIGPRGFRPGSIVLVTAHEGPY